jgi:DNA-binding MarR family transcriptional regulator
MTIDLSKPADVERLTRRQLRVLQFVREHPGCTTEEVWSRLHISRPYWALRHLEALRRLRRIDYQDRSRAGDYATTWKALA